MTSTQHPDLDALLHLAVGHPAAITKQHLEECSTCRRHLARIQGVLSAAGDELLQQRPFCPTSDELAGWQGEAPHPHLAGCALCRQEVELYRQLEAAGEVGTDTGHAPMPWMVPVESGGMGAAYLEAGAGDRLRLEPGQTLRSRVAGATVVLECLGGELRARLEGGGAVLVLGNEHLEKRLPLTPGEHRLTVEGWGWARIEAKD